MTPGTSVAAIEPALETSENGLALILPFLRPIEALIRDPTISEVMVNGPTEVFIERQGCLERVPGIRLNEKSLVAAIKNIARALGDDISVEQPLLDARLPDGSRVAAALRPPSVNGVVLTIRKFQSRRYAPEELVALGSLPASMLTLLRTAVERGENILISGGPGTGKTTMLNALARLIPDAERIVIIEDPAEIDLPKPDIVRFEARRAQGRLAAVTIKQLVRHALRHRADRLIVGEVRGAEAFDLLQAWNTGHAGSLSTIHASAPRLAVSRLASCVLMAEEQLPHAAIVAQIADSIQYVLQIVRRGGRRYAAELARVVGYSMTRRACQLESIEIYDGSGIQTISDVRIS